MAKKQEIIELQPISPKIVTIEIEGDSDLILNKMNDVTKRELVRQRKDKAKSTEEVNEWEKIITAIHWRDGNPKEFSEESLKKCLKANAPCIPAFAFKKTIGQAIVRNKIDTYSTRFDASVNIMGNGLIPVLFSEHHIDEKLMQPQKGSPVLVKLNRFSGWRARLRISCLENVYSIEQLVNFVNLAGFGVGIGSGKTSGYGRYHVVGVQ